MPSSSAHDRIAQRVRALLDRRGGPVLVAVDGHSGSGKSTLARRLVDDLGAVLVEGDDFYRDMAEDERRMLDAAAGVADYFDWRRMREEALVPLSRGQVARYHPYDWAGGTGLAPGVCELLPHDVVVVDGVYSARPELADLVMLAILVETDPDERLRRMAAREHGHASWHAQWDAQWDAAEKYYFLRIRPRESFDIVVPG